MSEKVSSLKIDQHREYASSQRNARWVTIVGAAGLGLAVFNGSISNNVPWMLVYALFVTLVAQTWWLSSWPWVGLVFHQFLILGIIQSIGVATIQDGGATSPNTVIAAIFFGFTVSGLVTCIWIAVAHAASWLEERLLSLRS